MTADPKAWFERRARHHARFHSPPEGFDPPFGFGWRHGGHGPFGRGFGPGFLNAFFGPGGPRRGPRMRRGDVRAAILALLREEPRNGYQVIQEIERRSGGLWRASAGSVYPALQQLEDEGLIETFEDAGRRLYRLTDAGRSYADEHPDELAAPWASVAGSVDDEARSLFEAMAAVGAAAVQVGQAGSEAQVTRARQVLSDTRKALYRILSEEGETGDPPVQSH
jgi:DNA-binding PadR family transcriptional regulator